ncbi:MAG: type VI secretion system baseplate subunit TssG [Deltaproteobacteria bacterium]|jgi:type VI secretion system protein ImpH|nr:type VI secretion system baseplate subunit TssG [Deltaproteobacteria bacterium]
MIEELLKDPRSFSYFQALRLLFLANQDRFSSLSEMINNGLKITASTDLAFPASDLTAVNEYNDGYDLTVTFMGLCGAASPLPPFYAQEILDDVLNEDYSSDQLINLISLPSYRHHAAAFFHNQLAFRLLEENDQVCWEMIRCLLGRSIEAFRGKSEAVEADLPFMGLLASHSRTAEGLLAYITGRFNLPGAGLTQCVLRWVSIPESQRLRLGGDKQYRRLGGSVLGRRVRDRCSQFDLTLPVSDPLLFEDLKPGGRLREDLEAAVDLYLNSPLVYSLNIVLAPGVAKGASLGQDGVLGRWTCLSPPDSFLFLESPASGDRGPL